MWPRKRAWSLSRHFSRRCGSFSPRKLTHGFNVTLIACFFSTNRKVPSGRRSSRVNLKAKHPRSGAIHSVILWLSLNCRTATVRWLSIVSWPTTGPFTQPESIRAAALPSQYPSKPALTRAINLAFSACSRLTTKSNVSRPTMGPIVCRPSFIDGNNECAASYKTTSLPSLLYDLRDSSTEDEPSAAYRATSESTMYDARTGGETRLGVCGSAKVTASKKVRSEEHTSELQSLRHLVCRLLL